MQFHVLLASLQAMVDHPKRWKHIFWQLLPVACSCLSSELHFPNMSGGHRIRAALEVIKMVWGSFCFFMWFPLFLFQYSPLCLTSICVTLLISSYNDQQKAFVTSETAGTHRACVWSWCRLSEGSEKVGSAPAHAFIGEDSVKLVLEAFRWGSHMFAYYYYYYTARSARQFVTLWSWSMEISGVCDASVMTSSRDWCITHCPMMQPKPESQVTCKADITICSDTIPICHFIISLYSNLFQYVISLDIPICFNISTCLKMFQCISYVAYFDILRAHCFDEVHAMENNFEGELSSTKVSLPVLAGTPQVIAILNSQDMGRLWKILSWTTGYIRIYLELSGYIIGIVVTIVKL